MVHQKPNIPQSSMVRMIIALHSKPGSATAFRVLLNLVDRQGENAGCWPKITTIASDCEMSERTVQRAVDQLENRGLISITRRNHRRSVDDRARSNWYEINWGALLRTVGPEHFESVMRIAPELTTMTTEPRGMRQSGASPAPGKAPDNPSPAPSGSSGGGAGDNGLETADAKLTPAATGSDGPRQIVASPAPARPGGTGQIGVCHTSESPLGTRQNDVCPDANLASKPSHLNPPSEPAQKTNPPGGEKSDSHPGGGGRWEEATTRAERLMLAGARDRESAGMLSAIADQGKLGGVEPRRVMVALGMSDGQVKRIPLRLKPERIAEIIIALVRRLDNGDRIENLAGSFQAYRKKSKDKDLTDGALMERDIHKIRDSRRGSHTGARTP